MSHVCTLQRRQDDDAWTKTRNVMTARHTCEKAGIQSKDVVESPLAKGKTVLVVDDEKSIPQLAERLLEDLRLPSHNGQYAAAGNQPGAGGGSRIHLLITDLVMPEMNGWELAERIQAMHAAMKTLFMSGYTANIIADRGVLEKGVHFVSKPLSRRMLALKVREALEGE